MAEKILTPRQEKQIERYLEEGKTPIEVATLIKVKTDVVKRFMERLILKREHPEWYQKGVRSSQPKVDSLGALKLTKSFLKAIGYDFKAGDVFDWEHDSDNKKITINLVPVKD
ncbi:MAG: hypothetical protein KMY53_12065 [Desulfarculus sp.]|nr:hypothetical protein [Pseudomonadota bacterium]MBV1738894.1 hypothetical protein [Desulfarculus sp.]